MNLLLDTHALLWVLLEDQRLTRGTALAIVDTRNTIFVSSISGLEVATKVRISKLPEASHLVRDFANLCSDFDFRQVPVTLAHSVLAGSLPGEHRDPFDRVLAAQGEKKIQIGSADGNPFTKGSALADTDYKIGDSYTFEEHDRVKQETRRFTQRVTQVTDNEIIFNDGRLVFDRLGNLLKLPDGRRYTGRQDYPLEFAIGKKWKTRYSVKNEKGSRWEPEFEFRIVRRERVTVPAGSFDCFVIEGEGWSSTERGFKVLHNLKRWMAPDKCRRAIVTEQFHRIEGLVGRPFDFGKKGTGRIGEVLWDDRFELVAFSQF